MSQTPNQAVTMNLKDPARWWGLGEVVRLSVPGVLNTVSFSIMQFVDGWMVAKVSPEAMAAQLMGSLVALTLDCFFMGILSCISTFASQNLGAGQPDRAARYGWQGLWLAWAVGLAQALLIPVAGPLLGLFVKSPTILALGTGYFQVLVAGAGLMLMASALGSYFLGIHKPMIPLVAGVIGNAANLAWAYILIFGKFGFPAMGLMGAAVGTFIGLLVQAGVFMAVFVAGPLAREFQVRRQWRFSWTTTAEFLRIGIPAGAMFLGDILMWVLFLGWIVGTFGKAHLEASTILWRYWSLCFLPALGVGTAATAIVGRHCGARRPDLTRRRAHAALLLVEAYMVGSGAFMWIFRGWLVAQFNESGDPVVQAVATDTFICILLCQAFDAMNVIFISSLRGAGDTLVPGIVQIVLAYVVGLGGSALVAHFVPQWGSFGPWCVASGYIIILGLYMWSRFLRGQWQGMTLVEAPVAPIEESSVLPPVRA
jgi:MATE family multidrug resistance protein